MAHANRGKGCLVWSLLAISIMLNLIWAATSFSNLRARNWELALEVTRLRGEVRDRRQLGESAQSQVCREAWTAASHGRSIAKLELERGNRHKSRLAIIEADRMFKRFDEVIVVDAELAVASEHTLDDPIDQLIRKSAELDRSVMADYLAHAYHWSIPQLLTLRAELQVRGRANLTEEEWTHLTSAVDRWILLKLSSPTKTRR